MAAVVTIIPSMQGLGTVTGTTQRTRNEHKKDAQICWLKSLFNFKIIHICVWAHKCGGVSGIQKNIRSSGAGVVLVT